MQARWRSRGYLPHFDSPYGIQAVTFRLADSMPRSKRLELLDSLSREAKAKRFQAVEDLLDSGYGSCLLRRPELAEIVQSTLLHFDGERYFLLAWVVMPNHVHVLLELKPSHPLNKVMHSWKSFSANSINKLLGRSGPLYQPESFDRYIRDGNHLEQAKLYIEYNPVRAKLVTAAEDWSFSSASKLRRDSL